MTGPDRELLEAVTCRTRDDDERDAMDDFLIRWLLIGPAAPFPRGCQNVHDLPVDVQAELSVLTSTKGAIAQAWHDGETLLRAEAERLKVEPRWPGRRFFAEAIASEVRL